MRTDSRAARRRTKAFVRGDLKLEKIARRQMSRALFDAERNVVMDFSAKAGCTVAVKMFVRHMGLLEEATEYHRWIHRYRRQVFYDKHPTTPEDVLSRENDLFKVVRDPHTRVVSSYRYAARVYAKHTSKGEDLLRTLGLDDTSGLTFRLFLDYLDSIDVARCDSHYRRQVQVYEIEGLRHPFVCKLENLPADIAAFNAASGLAFDPTGLTSTHHAEKDPEKSQFVGDVTWADLDGTMPEYRHFYDAELLERVTNLYRDDIEVYGYEFPWPEVI